MRFIRGAVIADWKLFPIPRKTTWNTVGFAIFYGPHVDPTKIKEGPKASTFTDYRCGYTGHFWRGKWPLNRGKIGVVRVTVLSREKFTSGNIHMVASKRGKKPQMTFNVVNSWVISITKAREPIRFLHLTTTWIHPNYFFFSCCWDKLKVDWTGLSG